MKIFESLLLSSLADVLTANRALQFHDIRNFMKLQNMADKNMIPDGPFARKKAACKQRYY